MPSKSKKKTRKSRQEDQGAEIPAGPELPTLRLADPLRQELSRAISELIFAAQEVVTLAVQVNCDKKEDCILVDACRELSKKVYNFLQVQKKIAKERS